MKCSARSRLAEEACRSSWYEEGNCARSIGFPATSPCLPKSAVTNRTTRGWLSRPFASKKCHSRHPRPVVLANRHGHPADENSMGNEVSKRTLQSQETWAPPPGRHAFFEVVPALPLLALCPLDHPRVPSSPVVFLTPLSSGRQSAVLPDWTSKTRAGRKNIAHRLHLADVLPALWASQALFAPSARRRYLRRKFLFCRLTPFPLSQNCQCFVFVFSSLFLCSGPFGPEIQKHVYYFKIPTHHAPKP